LTYSAKLVRGSYTFDLNDGKYSLGQDFAPPGVLETAFLSGGTSANRSGGADLVGTRAENRSWSFTVRCLGSVSAETHNLVSRLVSFLAGATDTRQDKTYFEFRPDADLPEPIWGTFGQALRYEVVHATTALDDLYGRGQINRSAILMMVNLTIKPFAQGRPLRTCLATDGILEDRVGTVDNSSRGVILPPATTNYVKNPIFGNSTPLTGWTATTVTARIDRSERLFGINNILLSGAAGKFETVTDSIAAGTYTQSCYAKKKDGTPITDLDVKLGASTGTFTTTYTPVGNGWYRLTCSRVLAAPSIVYVSVWTIALGTAVVITGFQLSLQGTDYPLCHGDMLGATWSGTAHNSNSVRSVDGLIKNFMSGDLVSNPLLGRGTMRIVIKMARAYNELASRLGIVYTGSANSLRLYYHYTNFQFVIGVPIFTAGGAVQSFIAGATFTLHLQWSTAGVKLYVNGTADGSVILYTGLFWGMAQLGDLTAGFTDKSCTFLDFALFDEVLTPAQIAADYARIAPLAAADVNIGRIPWIYTKEVASNVNRVRNALDTNNSNFVVVGGVPGSAECDTEMILNPQMTWDLGDNILISNLNAREFINPSLLYFDINTTADADRSGGGYGSQSIASPNYIFDNFQITVSPFIMEALVGKNIYLMVNMDDAGSGLEVKSRFYTGTGVVGISDFSYTSDPKPFVDTASFQFFLTNPLLLSSKKFYTYASQPGGVFTLGFKRATGTADVKLDFFEILSGKLILVMGSGNGIDEVVINGMHANIYGITNELSYHSVAVIGSGLGVTPDQYNVLTFFFYPYGAIVGPTRDLLRFILIPRWHLL